MKTDVAYCLNSDNNKDTTATTTDDDDKLMINLIYIAQFDTNIQTHYIHMYGTVKFIHILLVLRLSEIIVLPVINSTRWRAILSS